MDFVKVPVAAFWALSLMWGVVSVDGSSRPNIVWLFADDLGYADIGFRNPEIHTPNLDNLAASGVIFNNSYVLQQCTPSRHALMTGRYPHTSGMNHGVISEVVPWCSGLEYKFLPSYLKELGYSTHMFGKWHLGSCRKECTPTYRGFDTFTGAMAGQGHYFNHTTEDGAYDWFDGTELDRSVFGQHSQDLLQNGAVDVIRNTDESDPLFLYMPFHNAHSPMEPKEEFLTYYEDWNVTETRRGYLGLLSGLDYAVGTIVDELKASGRYNNTYIIFSSDNGGDIHEGDNSPWRGAKSSLFEGGVKASQFIHSPLLEKTGYTHDGLLHLIDWLPTLMSLAGGSVPEEDGIDGLDQSDMILRGGPSARNQIIYFIDREKNIGLPQFGEMAIRNKRYKLIWGMPGYNDGYGMAAERFFNMDSYIDRLHNSSPRDRVKRGGRPNLNAEQERILDEYIRLVQITPEQFNAGTGEKQLFDLLEDPAEMNDLSQSAEHQAIVDELTRAIQDAVADKYVGVTPESQIFDPRSLAHNFGNAVGIGWCEDTLPLPGEEEDDDDDGDKDDDDDTSEAACHPGGGVIIHLLLFVFAYFF